MPTVSSTDRNGSRRKLNTGQLFNFIPGSYLERTSRPFYSVLFLLPFIVFYELGTVMINTDVLSESQVRVVAFAWLQDAMQYIGLGGTAAWMMPPLAVVVLLLALHIAGRKGWQFDFKDALPMAVECALLAVPLIVFGLFLNTCGGRRAAAAAGGFLTAAAPDGPGRSVLADVVTGIGAGIYEELVFRLVLICALMILFQNVLRLKQTTSAVLSIVISSALFSAHHHVVFTGGAIGFAWPFRAAEFAFRTAAGVYFAMLFAIRGFGITAGTHAFYDILAVCINTLFFAA